jgi:sarcosine oxidase subunit beta
MIAIIGAGSHGISLAYHLALKDVKDVVLIESKRVNYGSSSRNLSRFRYNFYNRNNVEFALEAIPYAERLARKLPLNPLFYRTGYLWLLPESLLETYERLDEMWRSYGVGGEFLSCDSFSFLKDVKSHCYFVPRNGAFHHDYLVYGMWTEVKGKYRLVKARATRIIADSKVRGVELEGSKVEADTVIVTAGAWTSPLLRINGIDVPITPERKEAYITESLSFKVRPLVIDLGSGVYFSQTLKGEIIGGTEESMGGFIELGTSLPHLLKFLTGVRRLVRGIEGIGILRSWSGYYEMTPDHSHVMGRSDEWPEGLFLDAGYSGHGIMFSPYAGKLMADLVADQRSHRFFEVFSPSRFKGGKPITETLVI